MTATAERQAANVDTDGPFDPLVDLDGLWTVDLAAKYLPIPGMARARYECWNGRLFMTPHEGVTNSYGELELGGILRPGARMAGLYVCGPVNIIKDTPNRWLQPDLTVIHGPQNGTYVLARDCVLPIEFVSPSSGKRDRIDKPAIYADWGVPYYMTVELKAERELAVVALYKLVDGKYRKVNSVASGQTFHMTEPFKASFDPADLFMR